MTGDDQDGKQPVFDALADPDCRRIVVTLDEPMTAKEIAQRCDLPQTSTYRKLGLLGEAGFIAERTEVRSDGHHTTRYVRNVDGLFVAIDGDEPIEVDAVNRSESPDERLARFWSQISDEL